MDNTLNKSNFDDKHGFVNDLNESNFKTWKSGRTFEEIHSGEGQSSEPVNDNSFFGLGQGPDKHVKVNYATPPSVDDQTKSVIKQVFEELFWQHMPPELRNLCWNHAGKEPPDGEFVATVVSNGTAWKPSGGGIKVKGTPSFGKGIFARGYTRASEDIDWFGDDGPTDYDASDYNNVSSYSSTQSGLKAWLPTWDYPRVYE